MLLLVLALIAFEAVRLRVPTTATFTETWHFETPSGPKTVSRRFVLKQYAAIPYLPGGETERRVVEGANLDLNVVGVDLSAKPIGPISLHSSARRLNAVRPVISLKGLRNEYATGFLRRIKRARMEIDVQVSDLRRDGESFIEVTRIAPSLKGMEEPLDSRGFRTMETIERYSPGVRLVRITLKVDG